MAHFKKIYLFDTIFSTSVTRLEIEIHLQLLILCNFFFLRQVIEGLYYYVAIRSAMRWNASKNFANFLQEVKE